MINEIKNHLERVPSIGVREFSIGNRNTNEWILEPNEVLLEKEIRWIGDGLRIKGTKALFLASYVPLFLIADAAAASSDNGGVIVFLVCCAISIYLFNATSWGNEKLK